MNVSIIVASYGEPEWACTSVPALESARGQGAVEVLGLHYVDSVLARTRNAAAEVARGDWLCFVDADDRLAPGYLEAMRAGWANFVGAPDPPWYADAASPALLVPAIGYGSNPPSIPAWDRSLLDVNCACIGTLIPRRLFHEVGGFRDDLESLEDFELWLRCVAAGARMVPVPRAVYLAQPGDRRNSDQSPYERIRAEHGARFGWANVAAYKVGQP